MNKKLKKIFQSVGGPGDKKSLFAALDLAKGITAESSTMHALQTIKPNWLVVARAATDKENGEGIDMFLTVNFFSKEHHVPLQIKSSEKGLKKHIKLRRKKQGRFIVGVIIKSHATEQEIVRLVKRALDYYFEGKRKFALSKQKEAKQKKLQNS